MIERKLKHCPGKDHMAYLFSGGLCKACWQAKKAKPIKKVSDKHKEILDLYKIVNGKFKEANPLCQAKLKGCTIHTESTHHKKGKNSKEDWLNVKYFMATCNHCHRIIEDMGEEVYELGFKIRRI